MDFRISGVCCSLAAATVLAFAQTTLAGEPGVTRVPGSPMLELGKFKLDELGYVTEEFFLAGNATSYKALETPADGNWKVDIAATAPYATRIVVLRPADTAKFNGSVIVEWLNVSLGTDTPADWYMAHRELMRDGFVYVGVSAQKVGVDGTQALAGPAHPLTKLDPARYGRLMHPGDAYAFDIFSQAGKAIRAGGGAKVLGPLKASHVIAIGESQSAAFMTTYVDAIHPREKVYDGFIIHSRGGFAVPVEGVMSMNPTGIPNGIKIRTDLNVPVLTFITESDLIGLAGGFYSARQPDSDRIRTWEIAGTAHADNYIWQVAAIDSGRASINDLAAAWEPMRSLFGKPLDHGINAAAQHHYSLEAAIFAVNEWVAHHKAPPQGAPLQTTVGATPQSPPSYVRDALGNVKGGVRTPWVDVPTAMLTGVSNGGEQGLTGLSGVTEPFSAERMAMLYPGGRHEYMTKFKKSLSDTVKAGYILQADVPEIEAIADKRFQ
jgi:Alpha/beta hydrolase domain